MSWKNHKFYALKEVWNRTQIFSIRLLALLPQLSFYIEPLNITSVLKFFIKNVTTSKIHSLLFGLNSEEQWEGSLTIDGTKSRMKNMYNQLTEELFWFNLIPRKSLSLGTIVWYFVIVVRDLPSEVAMIYTFPTSAIQMMTLLLTSQALIILKDPPNILKNNSKA